MAVPSPVGDSNTESSISILCEYLHNPTNSGREGTRKAPGTKLKQSSYCIGRFYSPFSQTSKNFFFLAGGGGGGVVNEVHCGLCESSEFTTFTQTIMHLS